MGNQVVNPDVRVATIAARQHGVLSVQQLRGAGLDKSAVFHRVRHGRLHRVHRGVYAVGHPHLTPGGRWMAAVLASGSRALLSHRSAAALWGLLPVPSGPVDVTTPVVSSGRARRAGIRLHRSPSVQGVASTARRGIPVTTPARTIADLRRVVTPAELRRALREASVLGLETGEAAEPTRSELEHLFLGLCRRHRLPVPLVNARVDRFRVDFLWPARRLIVETDGYRYHHGRQAFEDDRNRDLELGRVGFRVVRITHRQLSDQPREVAAALRSLL